MLPRDHRVTRGDDYRLITRSGVRAGGCGLTVSVRRRESVRASTRFGFIIPKRVGVAVVRNRIRRRLKALSAEALLHLPEGLDIVYRVFPEATALDFTELSALVDRSLERAVRKLGDLQASS